MNVSQRLLAYAQLCRIPNVFTAIADVAMGYLFVAGTVERPGILVILACSSALLYSAGMVLNDVFDYEVDAQERPARPIPSGRITLTHAKRVGYSLLICGVGIAWIVSVSSGVTATLLAAMIYTYDAVVKGTWLAPLAMGGCRMLNVLLGMSGTGAWMTQGEPAQWLVAVGIGVYVVGITIFARSEARTSGRSTLVMGALGMLLGIVMLASLPWVKETSLLLQGNGFVIWPLLLGMLMASVARRCVIAISNPIPLHVQAAVKQSILSLIPLDASLVLATCGPAPAVAVLALLLPTWCLAQWVYST